MRSNKLSRFHALKGLILIAASIHLQAEDNSATNTTPQTPRSLPIPGWRANAKPDAAMKAPPGYPRSPFTAYRDFENWQFLADPAMRTNWYDVYKYIPLADRPYWFLTLGGEIREKYEYWENFAFGRGPQDQNGYFLQRYMAHADAQLGPHVRVFAQMQSEHELGRNGGPRATDQDDVDLLQGFVDLTHRFSSTASLTLRSGRQELAYGEGRLFDIRENANVRLPFEGFRGILHLDKTEIDAFATRVVTIKPHHFDTSDPHWRVWGIYGTRELPARGRLRSNVDLYYVGLDRAAGAYYSTSGQETRHTIGMRYAGTLAQFDFDFEGGYQFGHLASQDVRAWFASGQVGYLFQDFYGAPRLAFTFDAYSGDEHRTDRVANTFYGFFPRAPYWDESPVIGQQNILAAHPRLTWRPLPRVTWNFSPIWYWRQSTDDGVYNFANAPFLAPNGNHAADIGLEIFNKLSWQVNDILSLNTAYQHFFRGDFLKSIAGTRESDYLAGWATLRF